MEPNKMQTMKRYPVYKKIGNNNEVTYNEMEELGRGAFGTVYAGVLNKNANQPVAVKQLHLKQDVLLRKNPNFQRQIDNLYKLNNPYIIKLYFCYTDPAKNIFLVTEKCKTQDLSRLIAQTQFSQEQKFKIAFQIIYAMKYMHQMECMHRDIKPQNILLTQEGNIKIADLGLAKSVVQDNLQSLAAHTLSGTPMYVAPQILNQQRYSGKCDVWSTGCLIYELLTKKKLFAKGTTMLLLKTEQSRYKSPEKKAQMLKEIKDQFWIRILSKMLTYGDQQRPSFSELFDQFQKENQKKYRIDINIEQTVKGHVQQKKNQTNKHQMQQQKRQTKIEQQKRNQTNPNSSFKKIKILPKKNLEEEKPAYQPMIQQNFKRQIPADKKIKILPKKIVEEKQPTQPVQQQQKNTGTLGANHTRIKFGNIRPITAPTIDRNNLATQDVMHKAQQIEQLKLIFDKIYLLIDFKFEKTKLTYKYLFQFQNTKNYPISPCYFSIIAFLLLMSYKMQINQFRNEFKGDDFMIFEGQKITLQRIQANNVFLNRRNIILNELLQKLSKLDNYMKQYVDYIFEGNFNSLLVQLQKQQPELIKMLKNFKTIEVPSEKITHIFKGFLKKYGMPYDNIEKLEFQEKLKIYRMIATLVLLSQKEQRFPDSLLKNGKSNFQNNQKDKMKKKFQEIQYMTKQEVMEMIKTL